MGNNRTIKIDVRIISATNKELTHEIEEGRFRDDLYYRLNVVNINLPPLRERHGDILLLIYFFLKRFCGDLKKKIKEIHPLAIKRLGQDLVEWNYDNIPLPLSGINLEEVERHLVIKALKMCDYVQKDAAKLLNLSQRVLNYKIKRFGITHPRWKRFK